MMIFTPERIKECVTHDDDDSPVDCFEDAVPATNPYRDDLIAMLWACWRFTPIDSVCLDRWLQRVKDRAYILDRRYQLLIAEYLKDPSSLTSIKMGWTETRDLTGTSTPSGSDVRVTTGEDIPQVRDASDDTWLSSRTTDTATPGVTTTTKDTGSVMHTDNSRLNAEEYRDVMDGLVDPYVRYAEEFSDLFLRYYDLSGCDCGCRREPWSCSRCHAP